jgi:hypothetical protein
MLNCKEYRNIPSTISETKNAWRRNRLQESMTAAYRSNPGTRTWRTDTATANRDTNPMAGERDGNLWKRKRKTKTKREEAWLPHASLGASAKRTCSLRLATSPPSLPLVWPPRLHHSTCAVLLSLILYQGDPTALYCISNLYVHIWCATFCYGKWGQAGREKNEQNSKEKMPMVLLPRWLCCYTVISGIREGVW